MDKTTERMAFGAAADISVDQVYFLTPGTQSWQVPPGITSLSIVTVQGGQGGASAGGDGGRLHYINNVTVSPGEVLTIAVGAGGLGDTYTTSISQGGSSKKGTVGGHSSVARGSTLLLSTNASFALGTGFAGGLGGNASNPNGGAGAGAAGYAGNGGNGGGAGQTATAGAGGAGGGGNINTLAYTAFQNAYFQGNDGGSGGGVCLQGQGNNGAAGVIKSDSSSPFISGNSGQVGSVVTTGTTNPRGAGGAGGHNFIDGTNGNEFPSQGTSGQDGGVRIMWPGNLRQFPSTRTLDE